MALMMAVFSWLYDIETNKMGNNPQIIPSFRLLTNPACVTELKVLFLTVVSQKIRCIMGTVDACDSAAKCPRVSFTQNTENNNPSTAITNPK